MLGQSTTIPSSSLALNNKQLKDSVDSVIKSLSIGIFAELSELGH